MFLFVITKQKLILYFFLTAMSELSKYLNQQLGVILNVKQQK